MHNCISIIYYFFTQASSHKFIKLQMKKCRYLFLYCFWQNQFKYKLVCVIIICQLNFHCFFSCLSTICIFIHTHTFKCRFDIFWCYSHIFMTQYFFNFFPTKLPILIVCYRISILQTHQLWKVSVFNFFL